MNRTEWAKDVRIELIRQGMSIKDLAERSKYSYSTIRKALTGERNPEHVAKDLNRVLGIGKEQ